MTEVDSQRAAAAVPREGVAAAPAITVMHVLAMNPNKRGPLELQLLEMARQLHARGWRQVAVFSGRPPPWYADLLEESGCAFHWVEDPSTASARDVVQLAREVRADIVHLHFVAWQPLVRCLREAGFHRIVATEHSFRPRRRLELARSVVRHVRTRHVQRFIAVSEFMYRQTMRDFLIGPGRLRLIVNGVDLAHFQPPADVPGLRAEVLGLPADALVVTVAAHLHPAKRVDMVVRAMPHVLRAVGGAHLVIAGDGSERPRLEALARSLGVADRVLVLTGDNRVEQVYGASDVAVSASAGEGLGSAGAEAIACGLPLVATPGAGQSELLEDGVSGMLVRDETPAGLARAIIAVLQDDTRRARMGSAARERAVARFDVRRTVSHTIDVYRELLSPRTIEVSTSTEDGGW